MNRQVFFRERLTAIIGILLLALLIGASYLYSLQEYLAGLKYVPSPNSPDFKAFNIQLTDFNANGTPKQRVVAQRLEHFTDNRIKAFKVQYATLNPHLPELTVTADQTWSNDGLQTIELSGNILLNREAYANNPSLRFETQYLKGFLDTYTFETHKPVWMRWGTDTTDAQGGLHYDHIGHTIDLNGGVTSVIRSTTLNDQSSK